MHALVSRGRQYRQHMIFIEQNLVVSRRGKFIVMRETRAQPIHSECLIIGGFLQLARDGKHQHITQIADASAGQMRVAETEDGRIRIMITGASIPAFDRRVRAKLDKDKRHGRAGISVAMSTRADQVENFVNRMYSTCSTPKVL